MCKYSIVLDSHMWQDVLHNEMHDTFDTYGGQRSHVVLRLGLGSVLVHLIMEQMVPYI